MSNQPQKRRRVSIRSIARTYLSALKKRRWLFALVMASMLALQAVELSSPLFLRQIFNALGSGMHTPGVLAAAMTSFSFLVLFFFLSWLFRRINAFAVVVLESRTMSELYNSAFDYLIGHSLHFFSNQFTGTLTRRVTKFASAFEALMDSFNFQFLPTAVFVVGAVLILYSRNHTLGLVLGGWAVAMVAIQLWFAKWRQPLRETQSEEDSRTTGALADALTNQATITLFAGGPYEKQRFAAQVQAWYRATTRAWTGDDLIWAALGLLMSAVELSLTYLAIQLWFKGAITLGDFVLMQAYLFATFDRVVAINRDLRRFYTALADASEMVEILDEPHGIQDISTAKPLSVPEGRVEFRDVEFGFRDGLSVLHGFQLAIAGGEKVALVGPSGAGKSTVTKLLLRLYDVNAGSIEIDGQNIRTVTQDSLRERIGYVPQEPILFHRTLMENIRYGRRDATDEEVVEAAKKAHAHEFISGFPQGYETFVGERGVKLSGGERQRVAIARAILKNAPILVLDEATSSLDSESEHLIQEALDTLMEGKTVIVIAHRLSTIMKMDRIVVMEQGKIADEGTHDELLSHDGLYQKLWSIQAGGFIGGEGTDE